MDRRIMHSLLFHRINDHVNVNLSQSLMSVIYPIFKKKKKFKNISCKRMVFVPGEAF